VSVFLTNKARENKLKINDRNSKNIQIPLQQLLKYDRNQEKSPFPDPTKDI